MYYVSNGTLRHASQLPAESILSLGTCLGKFSKSGSKFKIHITALELLNRYGLHKVWIKPSSEMSFLYGNNLPKSGLAKLTDSIPQYGGVVVLSMSSGVALGFGVAAQRTDVIKDLDGGANVVLHQGDVGEYLRVEDDL